MSEIKKEFQCIDYSVNAYKFWAIVYDDRNGTEFTVYHGRIGANAKPKPKTFGSNYAMVVAAEKKIEEKIRKGYKKVTFGSSSNATRSIASTPIAAPKVVSVSTLADPLETKQKTKPKSKNKTVQCPNCDTETKIPAKQDYLECPECEGFYALEEE